MEKRDTLEGETVKREYCTAGLGSGALETERGGGESDTPEDVGRGSRGKSSSHSNPAPDSRTQDVGDDTFSYRSFKIILHSLSSEMFPSEESSEAFSLSWDLLCGL